MTISWDDKRMIELYKKRDAMFHEIGLMLEDQQLMHEIGDRDFFEFATKVLNPMIEIFHPGEPKELWKYRGVKVSLIRYYCDTFNTRINTDAN